MEKDARTHPILAHVQTAVLLLCAVLLHHGMPGINSTHVEPKNNTCSMIHGLNLHSSNDVDRYKYFDLVDLEGFSRVMTPCAGRVLWFPKVPVDKNRVLHPVYPVPLSPKSGTFIFQ